MNRGSPTEPERRRVVRAMCAAYFGFGMPIAMLGVAWPSIRDDFDQPNGALGILTTVYGIGRLVLSGSGGLQLRSRTFGPAAALAVGALAIASFAVAAAPSWPVLLGAVLFTGLASGALDALGGRFIASVGAVGTAGLLAGSYGVGATVGPAIVALGDRWRIAYAIAAVVALVGAFAVRRPSLRWPDGMGGGATASGSDRSRPTWRSPAVIVSALMMVCFVGVEVTVGSWTATFLEDARDIDGSIAGLAVSGFWAGVTVGRLALSVVDVGSRHLFALTALVALAVGSLTVLPGVAVIAGAVGVGLALAPFFPVIMATTIERVGRDHAPQVSGWQLVFGNIGATSIPAVTGLAVAVTTEWSIIVVVLVVCAAGAMTLEAARRLPAPDREQWSRSP